MVTNLVVDDVVMQRAHGSLANGSTIALLSRLPVAALQVAGSREADLNGTIDLEDVVEDYETLEASRCHNESDAR